MNPGPERGASRREFLRSAGRGAGLLLLAGTVLRATGRGRQAGPGQECLNLGVCGGCAVFHRCTLPLAASTRRTAAGGF